MDVNKSARKSSMKKKVGIEEEVGSSSELKVIY
jgi:hypothetical protein